MDYTETILYEAYSKKQKGIDSSNLNQEKHRQFMEIIKQVKSNQLNLKEINNLLDIEKNKRNKIISKLFNEYSISMINLSEAFNLSRQQIWNIVSK